MKTKKTNKPVFWISGNQHQVSKSWNNILSHVEEKSGEKPLVELMFAGFNPAAATREQCWATVDDIIGVLRCPDVFDSRPRIVKVCGLPENFSELVDWFSVINGRNILVIRSPFGYVKPGSKKWITAKTSKLYKKIKSGGFLIEHPLEASYESDAIAWVIERTNDFGKEISKEAAKEAVRRIGKNLDALSGAVQKLAVYQKKKEIGESDVKACCMQVFCEERVWKFIQDLDFEREDDALAFLQDFYAEGDGAAGESFYGRVQRLFGALLQHFQFLMAIKDACPKHLNAPDVERSLSQFKKITPTKVKELREGLISYEELEPRFSKYFLGNQIRQENITFAFRKRKSTLYRNLADLHTCILICRLHSNDDYFIRLCLDTFVLVVCEKLTIAQAGIISKNQGTSHEGNRDNN